MPFLFLLALRKPIENAKWMKWVPWVIALPYIANTSGWILTEMGRQPWIVQGLLKGAGRGLPEPHHAGPAHLADRLYARVRLAGLQWST
jgi:cytochrome bd-type quinol oxidase subunit 1